jgi:protein subunit release factor B
MKDKELLFSITKKDFELQFFCAGGPGGQNQNKVATACRIIHRDSGAVAESRVHRTQLQNKKAAFEKIVNTKEFKVWHKKECAKRLGQTAQKEEDTRRKVDNWMQENYLKIEYIE